MKLIRDKKQAESICSAQCAPVTPSCQSTSAIEKVISNGTWKILIVDDEPEVHAVTRLSASDLIFDGKKVEFMSAMSGQQARSILTEHPDIAVVLIDVVMETEDAGLRLVDYIRQELDNQQIRLIIRTGQPGVAPESYVVEHYDIDDYKDKTQLTAQRLCTTLRTTLKIYKEIDHHREGLEKILAIAPDLYHMQPIPQFLEDMLNQITKLCHNVKINHLLIVYKRSDKTPNSIQMAGTGRFAHKDQLLDEPILQLCWAIVYGKKSPDLLPPQVVLLPLKLHERVFGFIYLEEVSTLYGNNYHLLQIMANQCAAALHNLELYTDLERANHQNEQKNLFLGMAAHDLRSPLAIILNSVDLLKGQITDKADTEQFYYLFWIYNSAEFALNLVTNLLDVAKIESGHLELQLIPTDLVTTIEQTLATNRLFADTKHIELKFHCILPMPTVNVDPVKIQQLMNNLVSNALKYAHPQTKVIVNLQIQGDNILISVQDQGQGIPPGEIEKLFKPFSKTSVRGTQNEGGTGLGLLICRQVVEAHRGRIWLESEVGRGSTFYVSLPVI